MNNKLLIFHRTIAPYRIDFFNDLFLIYNTRICLQYRNLLSQKFDYDKIVSKFKFKPIYLKEWFRFRGRIFNKGYWEQLDNFQPDIVIVGEFNLDCILVLLHRFIKNKKYKIISMCDDSYNMVAENNDFSLLHRILRRLIVPKIDDLILIEPKVVDWYQKYYGKGIFFPIIRNDSKSREMYRMLLPMSKECAKKYNLYGHKIVLFVGRLVELKNTITLIKAYANIQNEKTKLVIIGDGPEKAKLEKVAKEESISAIFTGRLEGNTLLQWYNIANVFCLPSYQEAFGAVTNEALLAGCLGLISNKAGSQCLIENGKNGYTFSPYNIEELSCKMQKLLDWSSPLQNLHTLRPTQMLLKYEDKMRELIHHMNAML